ncbi:MAG: glycosyltransferase [Anaerolineae bacterium]|nr:glycosyltransferase [Anaerolineae bacterium]
MQDIVCVSHLRWDFVRQRPQHLLARLAKDYRITFVEEPLISTQVRYPYLEILKRDGFSNPITVVRLIYPATQEAWIGHGDARTQTLYGRLLKPFLIGRGIVEPVLWFYTPMGYDFKQVIRPSLVVYDVMDQLSAFKDAPTPLKAFDEALLSETDLVFTGGISLYRDKLPHNPNTHLFPSGIEIRHFAQAAEPDTLECPKEIAHLKSPILGYFGVVDERMDLVLLEKMAIAHPEWNILIIGPVVKISHDDLPKAPNLHYLGMKAYAELPVYLARFDVALIPFARNEATRFISPTKTLEYMAARKPIISTAINDVIELYGKAVQVGWTHDEFIGCCQTALGESQNPLASTIGAERRVIEDTYLHQNTWDDTAGRMSALIQKALRTKTTPTASAFQKPIAANA